MENNGRVFTSQTAMPGSRTGIMKSTVTDGSNADPRITDSYVNMMRSHTEIGNSTNHIKRKNEILTGIKMGAYRSKNQRKKIKEILKRLFLISVENTRLQFVKDLLL